MILATVKHLSRIINSLQRRFAFVVTYLDIPSPLWFTIVFVPRLAGLVRLDMTHISGINYYFIFMCKLSW